MPSRLPPEIQPFQDLQIFHDVARALTSSLDLDSILGVIMQQMERFFEPESWSLLIDTNFPDAEPAELFKAGSVYEVTGRSLLLFAVNPG